jgi:glutathione peroxidase
MNITAAIATSPSAWDFSFTAIDGKQLPLSRYKGHAVLVVNTASRCGFTPQYDALQQLWQNYKGRGLVVIGVPSDDFGSQELETEAKVKQFCEVNFDIDFPLAAITKIKGSAAHPFYQWAGQKAGMLARPKWNFHKYLIDRNGQLVDSFSSMTSPTSDKIRTAVEIALTR